ncbi:MAG: hypothetical protein ACI914_000702 [Candidatus Marivariicella framensis]|jgi:hypothetical protein|tara:strand:- start:328 stop:534 length:207 start_codon:yes stop_codon:yes gene_type:complete
MELIILFIITFIMSTMIFYKISIKYFKETTIDKMWKIWGIRSSYWEGLLIISFAISSTVVFITKAILF